jgi:alkylhydroperoxidase family enzyme
MARLRYLEGREAGFLARALQRLYRGLLGRELNPVKVIARVPRALLWSFFSNALMGTGRWTIGRALIQLVRVRVAALNGCVF